MALNDYAEPFTVNLFFDQEQIYWLHIYISRVNMNFFNNNQIEKNI